MKISDPVEYLSAQFVVSNLPQQLASPSLLLSTMAGAEMTRSATEQPDVDMSGPIGSTGPVSAMKLGTLPFVTQMHVVGDAA